MAPTSIELSRATLDRIRALGGASDEQTIIEALDALEHARAEALESARFWAQAEAAAAWRASLNEDERALLDADEARNAALFDGNR